MVGIKVVWLLPQEPDELEERHGVTVHVPPGRATNININVFCLVQTK